MIEDVFPLLGVCLLVLELLLVEGPEDANLVVFVLIEVKSVQVTIPKGVRIG